jgi:hypothetical protein
MFRDLPFSSAAPPTHIVRASRACCNYPGGGCSPGTVLPCLLARLALTLVPAMAASTRPRSAPSRGCDPKRGGITRFYWSAVFDHLRGAGAAASRSHRYLTLVLVAAVSIPRHAPPRRPRHADRNRDRHPRARARCRRVGRAVALRPRRPHRGAGAYPAAGEGRTGRSAQDAEAREARAVDGRAISAGTRATAVGHGRSGGSTACSSARRPHRSKQPRRGAEQSRATTSARGTRKRRQGTHHPRASRVARCTPAGAGSGSSR